MKTKRLTEILATSGITYLALRRAWGTYRELTSRRMPAFVYHPLPPDALGVPVLTYHSIGSPATPDSVTPRQFYRHMEHLARNGYTPLTADELHRHLVYGEPVPAKSVVITFDDGRASLWSAAYPILRRFGLRAVAFLVPGIMRGQGQRPRLNVDLAGHILMPDEIRDIDLGDTPAVTWEEASVMHQEGQIDFQSHGLYHALISCGPEIVDFFHPGFRSGFANCGIPIMRRAGHDLPHARPPWGTPIYRHAPRMGSARRYFDDEGLRQACIDHVGRRGGEGFFRQAAWREELASTAGAYRRDHRPNDAYETEEEQVAAIRENLVEGKRLIEEHLPGHEVRHLCCPWHRQSSLAAHLARQAGYLTTFSDINPHKLAPIWNDPYRVQTVLPINEYGDDPYHITRIDARDDIPLSLPGEGRLGYGRRVATRLLRAPGFVGALSGLRKE